MRWHVTFCGSGSERQGSRASPAQLTSHVNAVCRPQPSLFDDAPFRMSKCLDEMCVVCLAPSAQLDSMDMRQGQVKGIARSAHRRTVCPPLHSQYPGPAVIQAEHGWSSAGWRTLLCNKGFGQPSPVLISPAADRSVLCALELDTYHCQAPQAQPYAWLHVTTQASCLPACPGSAGLARTGSTGPCASRPHMRRRPPVRLA